MKFCCITLEVLDTNNVNSNGMMFPYMYVRRKAECLVVLIYVIYRQYFMWMSLDGMFIHFVYSNKPFQYLYISQLIH